MAHPTTLNEAQASVLKWIGNGCPSGVYDGVAHRISAAALARRGLVRVAGHGPKWSATITGDGKAYLERLASPKPPTPRQPNVSVTQQLVDDVIAAGGSARFPRPAYWKKDQVDYERRAALAHRFGKVPAGMQLVVTRVDDELEISLVDTAHEAPAAPAVVAVPGRVAKFHPLVAAFRADRGRHEVSRAELPRACRILHALITEAERRGYSVRASVPGPVKYGQPRWSGPTDGHFVIATDEYAATLRIHEEGLGSRSYWEHENQQKVVTSTGYYVARNRPLSDYEANATGRLTVGLLGYHRSTYRVGRWSDRRSWRLEDKVGDILWEIEVRSAEARAAREEAARAAAEREKRWEAAMRQAKVDLIERRRGESLRKQVGAWTEAQQIRGYCDAMLERHPDDAGAREWAEWAVGFAARLDPLRRAPQVPEPGEIRTADLQPLLRGWSPYGPTSR